MENPPDRTGGEPRFGVVGRGLVCLCVLALIVAVSSCVTRSEEPAGRASGSPARVTATPGQPVWLRGTHRSYRGLGPVDARCDSLPGTPENEKTLRELSLRLDRMWSATRRSASPEVAERASPEICGSMDRRAGNLRV